METNDICPRCGAETVNGVCLDCGITQSEGESLPLMEEISFEQDVEAAPLDDITAPVTKTLLGEEIKVSKKHVLPPFVNPYADVIPFEKPDYGDAYAAPRAVTRENGVPTAAKYDPDDNALISEGMKIKSGRRLREFLWLIVIALMLPWQISWLIAPPLMKFDEKGGRTAGFIILAGTALKMLAVEVLLK